MSDIDYCSCSFLLFSNAFYKSSLLFFPFIILPEVLTHYSFHPCSRSPCSQSPYQKTLYHKRTQGVTHTNTWYYWFQIIDCLSVSYLFGMCFKSYQENYPTYDQEFYKNSLA